MQGADNAPAAAWPLIRPRHTGRARQAGPSLGHLAPLLHLGSVPVAWAQRCV